MSNNDEEPYSTIFASLKHPVRRKILRMLSKKPMGFSEMLEVLGVSNSFLTYHLENLGELVGKMGDGKYRLSSFGEDAMATMTRVEDIPATTPYHSSQKKPKKIMGKSVLIALGLICIVLIALITYFTITGISATNNYSNLQKQNKQLQTWLTGNETLLSQTQTWLTENETLLNQTQTNSTTLQNQVQYLNSKITSLQEEVNNLIMMLSSAPVYATVYINADGSVTPPFAPISSIDNITYTLTGNVSYPTYYGIVVKKSNIIIDGNGYTVHGNYTGVPAVGGPVGLYLQGPSNVTIENVSVDGFFYGIYLDNSDNNLIRWNYVYATRNLRYSIFLNSSSNNVVIGNNASANQAAIYLLTSSYNNISGNAITTYTHDAIFLSSSSYNTVSGNDAVGNGEGIYLQLSSNNNAIISNDLEGDGEGIYLSGSSNLVMGNNVTEGGNGINLGVSSNNTVMDNNVTGNYVGIELGPSSNDIVSGNNIATNSLDGIYLELCSDDILNGNNITANGVGIEVISSSNQTIYHNNFIDNTAQVSTDGSQNTWNDGYPSGGNYWSDYNGTDMYSGPYQNVTGSDGIGDTPYIINANNTDNYPLMGAFSDFNVAEGIDFQIISNSTVSDFQFNGTALLFNLTGENGTAGFCRANIPTAIINGTLTVFADGTEVPYTFLSASNSTETYLYFTYSHSTEQVEVAPVKLKAESDRANWPDRNR